MPKITWTEVSGLERSILTSGYSMRDSYLPPEAREKAIQAIKETIGIDGSERDKDALMANKDVRRAIRLANAKMGGEDQFLTGITVWFDLDVSLKAWVQVERYKYLNFVSSYSLMHRGTKMDISDSCNKYVYGNSIHTVEVLQEHYKKAVKDGDSELAREAKLELLNNIPTGFELTAGMITNYRCLKNVYRQRRYHFLPDWQYICDWIEGLPLAPYLITGEGIEDVDG